MICDPQVNRRKEGHDTRVILSLSVAVLVSQPVAFLRAKQRPYFVRSPRQLGQLHYMRSEDFLARRVRTLTTFTHNHVNFIRPQRFC